MQVIYAISRQQECLGCYHPVFKEVVRNQKVKASEVLALFEENLVLLIVGEVA